ncbi:hypothetical protein JDN40_14395 [Rhodomicrobium vannielii ATCC 17100]|uniref:hypothetical protein n=1 Tax=Rhodomicrobium vannielii TaxID=1069 RepID=UPI00191ACE4F|nr:hypothetical protein [Rhodomicrobium vannielii]MBJ7535298.1 hypothetical protein [Rhodomicrobium vannielii ATCC 17100]
MSHLIPSAAAIEKARTAVDAIWHGQPEFRHPNPTEQARLRRRRFFEYWLGRPDYGDGNSEQDRETVRRRNELLNRLALSIAKAPEAPAETAYRTACANTYMTGDKVRRLEWRDLPPDERTLWEIFRATLVVLMRVEAEERAKEPPPAATMQPFGGRRTFARRAKGIFAPAEQPLDLSRVPLPEPKKLKGKRARGEAEKHG